jgi:hypothetical protein
MSVNGEMFATKSPNDECAAHLIMISFKISKRSEFAQTFVLSENKLILLWLSLYEQLKDIKEEIINRRRIYNEGIWTPFNWLVYNTTYCMFVVITSPHHMPIYITGIGEKQKKTISFASWIC